MQNDWRILRMLAEIDRLKQYAEKGDIAFTEIPTEVRDAYKQISFALKEKELK